jgi:hypothetical protein
MVFQSFLLIKKREKPSEAGIKKKEKVCFFLFFRHHWLHRFLAIFIVKELAYCTLF